MKLTIEGMSIVLDIPEEDAWGFNPEDLMKEAMYNAEKQLRDELTAIIKREFLADSKVQSYMTRKKLEMVNNLEGMKDESL